MRNKPTAIVLSALIFIFGYYTWEHFSIKKADRNTKLIRVTEQKKRLVEHQPQDGMDKAMEQEFELTKDPSLNIVPRERLLVAENFRQQKIGSIASRTTTAVSGINWDERGPNNVGGRTRAIMYDLDRKSVV